MSKSRITLCGALAGAVCMWVSSALPARAQDATDPNAGREIRVSDVDIAAASDAGPGLVHAFAAPLPGAKGKLEAVHSQRAKKAAQFAPVPAKTTIPLKDPFYPGDVTSGGGPTLPAARQHALFVNYTGSIASNWGDPEGFLRHLNRSRFIHITDQYTGTTGDERYPVERHHTVHYGKPGATLYESDIAAIVHAAAEDHGSGFENIYHVFLPKGTDTCFDVTPGSAPVCYSPDNLDTMAFCGYHDAVEFQDIGIVLFTVQPWQGSLCAIGSPAPNGVLADSTDNTLSHETFETITDPLPGYGYWNQTDYVLAGYEIADECINFNINTGAYYPPTSTISGKKYAVQLEYSNHGHVCTDAP